MTDNHPSVGHEESDVSVGGIFIFAVGLLVTAVIVHLLVWMLFLLLVLLSWRSFLSRSVLLSFLSRVCSEVLFAECRFRFPKDIVTPSQVKRLKRTPTFAS